MDYYDEIYIKLREIKFHCELQPNCDKCPYSKGDMFKYCRLAGAPYDWSLEDMEELNGKDKIH